MINVGNHTFSLIDARKTIGGFEELWSGYVADRDHAAVDSLRADVLPMLAGLDLETASEADLTKPLTAVWNTLLSVGQALRNGVEPARHQGEVAFLASSKGGVPKKSVNAVEVDFRGVIGDVQKNRLLHGRPFQALCLWSSEVIESLRADGHPIAPGLAGENVTLSGFDWSNLRPGARLALGTVLCEVSSFTDPCAQNAAWFIDGEVGVMNQRRGAVSRVYATIVEPGRVSVGDSVTLEP